MIEIKPDPEHPRGGFAEVAIEGATVTTDPVRISVFNSYQQKWLGPDGWQPNKATLPARAARQDGSVLRLIVGPDVVNQIEEDTPIRIEIGEHGWDTYWPDDVNAGPDEAVVGDIGGTGTAPVRKAPVAVAAAAASTAPSADGTVLSGTGDQTGRAVSDGQDEADEAIDEEAEPRGGNLSAILGGLVLVAVLGAVALFWFLQPAEEPDLPPEEDIAAPVDTPAPQPDEAADPCTVDALTALGDEGFATQVGQIRDCGGAVSADNALGFVERAAAADDPGALSLFGALYDGTVTDEVIEDQIGLTFADQPATAAQYYARAVAAGSQEAETRLAALCRRLLLETDTLSRSAHEDHCQ